MALDPSVVGTRGQTRVYLVEAGHVVRFAEAIGDDSPVYREPGAPIPPTFPTAFLPDSSVRDGLDMDWSRILHGGEEITFHGPVRVGDRLHVTPVIAQIYEKRGRAGVMDFLVIDTQARDDDGKLVYVARRTVIVKRREGDS